MRELHGQACALAAFPPQANHSGGPFQSKVHTPSAVVCGDWNFVQGSAEYLALQAAASISQPDVAPAATPPLRDAWALQHGDVPHPPTFCLFDRRYGPEPTTSDFVFVSADLRPRLRRVEVNLSSKASDHQPILLELV